MSNLNRRPKPVSSPGPYNAESGENFGQYPAKLEHEELRDQVDGQLGTHEASGTIHIVAQGSRCPSKIFNRCGAHLGGKLSREDWS